MIRSLPTLLLCCLVVTAVSCTNVSSRAPEETGTLQFVFRYSPCGGDYEDILDTRGGTLMHRPLGQSRTITIPFKLTAQEAAKIREEIVRVNFFGYPEEFSIPKEQVKGIHMPAATYSLSVTGKSTTHEVHWVDETFADPPYAPAEQLRGLMNLIRDTIRSHPEYQKLPESTVQCA